MPDLHPKRAHPGMTEFLSTSCQGQIRMTAQQLRLTLEKGGVVSAPLLRPDNARACFVLAHGAGAGMWHPFMEAVATGLAGHGIATLRYQFPYMEKGSKRPDAPAVAHAAVRAAVAEAAGCCSGLPLIAGGKSFGGHMTSQAQAIAPRPDVCGLVFLGFPLHPPGKPSIERAAHLADVKIPLLFLQGTREQFAELHLLEPVVKDPGGNSSRRPPRPSRDWLQNMGGSIGFSTPVATGAAVACPDRKVICMVGDGSAMYTLQSLWTQAREGLNVLTIVFANRIYQILRGEFDGVGAGEPGQRAQDMLKIDRTTLDFVSLAKGMGVKGRAVTTADEFIKALDEAMAEQGPRLIEVQM